MEVYHSCEILRPVASAAKILSNAKKILVFGIHSDVGSYLLPRLIDAGWSIYGFSRNQRYAYEEVPVTWLRSTDFQKLSIIDDLQIPTVISLMPIWVLPDHKNLLDIVQATTLIAFSSSSIIAKKNSANNKERSIVALLQRGEAWVNDEFTGDNRSAFIFRPTMIYGGKYNRNINRLTRLIQAFRFFLLPGKGSGLRQPVHAEDLAELCMQCLTNRPHGARTYLLAGGETLRYREMIERIFSKTGHSPKIVTAPAFLMRGIVKLLQHLPNQRDITLEMVARMEQDLCYDDQKAINELGWRPRKFYP